MKIQNINTVNYSKNEYFIRQPQFGTKKTLRLHSIKQDALDIVSAAAGAVGLAHLVLNPMAEASDTTLENLKNKSIIFEKFKKRYDNYCFLKLYGTSLNALTKKFGTYHQFLIFECMKHEDFSIDMIMHDIIAGYQIFHNPRVFNHVTNLIQSHPDFPPELIYTALLKCDNLQLKNSEELYKRIDEEYDLNGIITKTTLDIKEQMLANPSLYINGNSDDKIRNKEQILGFYNKHFHSIYELTEILGKEAVDVILRKRMTNANDVFYIWNNINSEMVDFYKKLVNCDDINGNQLTINSKLELINLLYIYQKKELPLNELQKSIEKNELDIENLELNIFKQVLINAGISKDLIKTFSKEKLLKWDCKYIHNLAMSIEDYPYKFTEIIKAANLYNFKTYIHDKNNLYGKTNAETEKMFNIAKIDYKGWANPNKSIKKEFKVVDNNSMQLKYIAEKISVDIESLCQNPEMRKIVNKRFPDNVKNEKFVISNKIYASKNSLDKFLKNLNTQLQDVWLRAENNKKNKTNSRAAEVLTIKDHLNNYQETLKNLPNDTKGLKNIDWTIKMWDRYPQKDLFQGNYSTCCIRMGSINSCYMPDYLTNTVFNMIEIVDNDTGNIIGNALCYFVKDSKKNLAFVIDNVEINTAKTLSSENGTKLREAIADYSKEFITSIGAANTPIYIGKHFNDVPVEGLKEMKNSFNLLGKLSCSEIYLDFYHNGNAGAVYDWEIEHVICNFFMLR